MCLFFCFRWNNNSIYDIQSGLDSGPLLLFDHSGNTIIISPFNNFMAASASYDQGGTGTTVSWGVMGMARHIPQDFVYWTAVMYSSEGINKVCF